MKPASPINKDPVTCGPLSAVWTGPGPPFQCLYIRPQWLGGEDRTALCVLVLINGPASCMLWTFHLVIRQPIGTERFYIIQTNGSPLANQIFHVWGYSPGTRSLVIFGRGPHFHAVPGLTGRTAIEHKSHMPSYEFDIRCRHATWFQGRIVHDSKAAWY